MRTAVRTALTTPLVQFDPDARTYIAAVERADGQALETGVRQAIDAFVRGCKRDGIWEAIKTSCILAGARTLSGALVPLKGTAPTNFNFVSGDYNRKTGLVGDGSTKYLNSNRNNNADPQDNASMSVYVSTLASGTSYYIGADGGLIAGTSGLAASTVFISRHRTSTANVSASAAVAGFFGVSRTASGSYLRRRNNSTETVSQASDGLESSVVLVFRRGSPPDPQYSNVRLAFYSIGESLDLALLDARVTTLINTLSSVIP